MKIKMTLRQKFKKIYNDGFFHVMIGEFSAKIISFISSILIVRFVTKEEYGQFAYVSNLYSYITIFSGMGLGYALLKFINVYNEPQLNQAYLKFSIKFGSIFQIVLTSILIVYALFFDLPFENAKTLIIAFAFVPLVTYILENLLAAVRGYRQNKLYSYISITQTILILLSTLLFIFKFGVFAIPLGRYISAIAAIVVLSYVIKSKLIKGKQKTRLSSSQRKAFLSLGFMLMISNVFSQLIPLNESFLVNYMIADELISAEYKAAILIPSQITFISSSIMIFFFPIFSVMKDKREILKLSLKVQLLNVILIIGVVFVGIIITPFLVNFLFGVEYNNIIRIFRYYWLVFGVSAGLRVVPINILPAIGKSRFTAIMSISTFIVHFASTYFILLNKNIENMAVATLIIYFVSGIIYWGYLIMVTKSNDKIVSDVD